MKEVYILPEFWDKSHIGACGWIRLLNPLLASTFQPSFRVQYGYDIDLTNHLDIVIFERLWHPMAVDIDYTRKLLKDLKAIKTKIVYSIDDNLFDYHYTQKSDWFKSKHLSLLHLFLHYADLVVVSTEALKERISNYHPNIEVIKNVIHIPERIYPQQKRENKTKFGYLLSPDNITYLFQIIEPLKEVLYQYRKEVVFEIIGHPSPHLTKQIFNDLPVEFHFPPDSAYRNYIKWIERGRLWDFGLAPISSNSFTVCKSDMKFLDFTRLGVPGIFTDFTPYKDVKQQSAGYLSKNDWDTSIRFMIESPEKRAILLHNAEHYVSSERNPQVQAREWLDVFDSLV
jgi:hypothetical protein